MAALRTLRVPLLLILAAGGIAVGLGLANLFGDSETSRPLPFSLPTKTELLFRSEFPESVQDKLATPSFGKPAVYVLGSSITWQQIRSTFERDYGEDDWTITELEQDPFNRESVLFAKGNKQITLLLITDSEHPIPVFTDTPSASQPSFAAPRPGGNSSMVRWARVSSVSLEQWNAWDKTYATIVLIQIFSREQGGIAPAPVNP